MSRDAEIDKFLQDAGWGDAERTHVPGDAFELIDMIVFRQPTRKQIRLSSVWGRLLYWATIGRRTGTAIYL